METLIKWTKKLSADHSEYVISDEKGQVICHVLAKDFYGQDASKFVEAAELIERLPAQFDVLKEGKNIIHPILKAHPQDDSNPYFQG